MDVVEYLNQSPSPSWACENAAAYLEAQGFQTVSEINNESPSKIILRLAPGMLFAAVLPQQGTNTLPSFRVVGAHSDSPHIRLKPNAQKDAVGYATLAGEIYGGLLNYTWFDRELGIAGEVFYRAENQIQQKLVRIDKPLAIVPSLAIHLQRSVNEEGFVPQKAMALNPLFALESQDGAWINFLASEAKIAPESILSYDLSFFDLRSATRGGFESSFLFSARLDNLASAFTAIRALAKIQKSESIACVLLFDHEEVGSVSEAGAQSTLTTRLFEDCARLYYQKGLTRQMLEKSLFLSADMAHGVHPHFSEKHDGVNVPRLGGGVTLKVNQNRRYASSAFTQAVFHDICIRNKIPSQVYTHRNDLPCGSTIGPIVSAQVGIPTLDVGIPILGMHSIRETCAWQDLESYYDFMLAFMSDRQ